MKKAGVPIFSQALKEVPASLAAFFADTPFQPPFGGGGGGGGGGGETLEGLLPPAYRRVRPLEFPATPTGKGESAQGKKAGALSGAAASPFRQILLDPAVSPLLRLHPFQAEGGREGEREGEREWLDACRELLRERLGYGTLGSPVASLDGALEQAEGLLRSWIREKHLAGDEDGSLVFIATEEEIASGAVPPSASPVALSKGRALSFLPDRLYLFTPAAIETEACGKKKGARGLGEGPGPVAALVTAIHQAGSLAGLASVDVRWLGAGFHPARMGFDLAFFDFAFLLEGEGEWHLPVFDRSFAPWLSPDADEEWTSRPDLLVRVEAGLRLMGEEGLAAAATAAAIRADACRRLLAKAEVACAGSLLEVVVSEHRKGRVRFSGIETAEEIEALVRDLTREHV